jgi:hypothetical protein
MTSSDDLAKLIAEANARFDALTPEQKRAHREEQRRSYLRAEAAFGSDADEAAYRAALASDDKTALVALEAQAVERMSAVDRYLKDEKEGLT